MLNGRSALAGVLFISALAASVIIIRLANYDSYIAGASALALAGVVLNIAAFFKGNIFQRNVAVNLSLILAIIFVVCLTSVYSLTVWVAPYIAILSIELACLALVVASLSLIINFFCCHQQDEEENDD